MAFLAPAAAAASATGAATALGTAAGATTALGAGLTTGAAMGSGGIGLLQAMGAAPLAGMTSILPTAAAAPGIIGALPAASAALPTAGIFANPAAAGFLGKSFAPLAAQTVSPLATAGTTAGLEAAKAGIIKNAMTQNAMQNAIMQNVAGGQAAQNLAGAQLAGGAQSLTPGQLNFLRSSTAGGYNVMPPETYTGGLDATKGLLGNAAKVKEVPSVVQNAPQGSFEAYKQWAQSPAAQQAAANEALGATRFAEAASPLAKAPVTSPIIEGENFLSNFGNLLQNPSMDAAVDYAKKHPVPTAMAAYGLYKATQPGYKAPEQDKGMIRPYEFAYNPNAEAYAVSPTADSREQVYFNPVFTPREPTKAAEGGIMALAVGGPVEQMAAMNAVGANTGYPQAGINTPMYSNPMVQRPEAVNVLAPSSDAGVGAYSGEPKFAAGGSTKTKETPYTYTYDPKTLQFTQTAGPGGTKTTGGIGALVGGRGAAPVAASTAYPALSVPAYQTPEQQLGLTDFYAMMDRRLGAMGGYAEGGNVYDLGSYSDGGRLLRGPGDGVSDSIPAVIGNKQPARLADGEFVIPARIVSELGNGSTEAGARKLYAMMDRVQKARGKTVGKNKVAANTRADKHLPA